MGFSVKHGGSAAGTRATPTTLAEINVTPLVDVMLVLLIVFMVSAPLMQQGVQVDLPRTAAGALNEAQDPVVISITKKREIAFNGTTIEGGTLRTRLEAMAQAKPDIQILIQGDQGVPYGVVAQVMAEVKRAKIHRIGLVTEASTGNEHKL
jgi:biopolymer transport protein TolR